MNSQQQVQNNQNMYGQPPMDKPRFLPLTFTNGVEGAKAYIVNPNCVMYILDSDNPILYQKTADYQGKYTLNAFKLEPIAVENIGKQIDTQQVSNTPNFHLCQEYLHLLCIRLHISYNVLEYEREQGYLFVLTHI